MQVYQVTKAGDRWQYERSQQRSVSTCDHGYDTMKGHPVAMSRVLH